MQTKRYPCNHNQADHNCYFSENNVKAINDQRLVVKRKDTLLYILLNTIILNLNISSKSKHFKFSLAQKWKHWYPNINSYTLQFEGYYLSISQPLTHMKGIYIATYRT